MRRRMANVLKCAIGASIPVLVGFARMFQFLYDHPQTEVEVFDTLEAAESWLASS